MIIIQYHVNVTGHPGDYDEIYLSRNESFWRAKKLRDAESRRAFIIKRVNDRTISTWAIDTGEDRPTLHRANY